MFWAPKDTWLKSDPSHNNSLQGSLKVNRREHQECKSEYFSTKLFFPAIGSLRQLNVTEPQFVFLLRWFAYSWLAVAVVPIINIDWSCCFSIWKFHRNIVSRTYWRIQLCYDLYHSDRVLQFMKRCDHCTECFWNKVMVIIVAVFCVRIIDRVILNAMERQSE